ncbi:RNase adapter RapZ [Falsarthrobacter nasiphocae]|uniref:UPF0042 nucleotide-binding protein n=1 Tax=Falsarthrobacter nasiphocae TaxID=189863 RepID=A0AAE3YDH3_9MICC|nr:RNase adapter RapZ [Falsarthrobacter nasiphocae]MDR6891165.1 UPF0042 nucleotide-binding protein [Falsarthrobacter nasiphocae]
MTSSPLVVPGKSEVLVVTSMSGAGRTTAGNALEDIGWHVVEQLPPQMIEVFASHDAVEAPIDRLAITTLVTSADVAEAQMRAIRGLEERGLSVRTLFLDAADDILVRRFEAGRRPHPFVGELRILEAIAAEREVMEPIRRHADRIIDTSTFNVHDLTRAVRELYSGQEHIGLDVTVMSFGFKRGLPLDADIVADVRFIPNPHWIPELRPLTGQSEPVSSYVLAAEGAQEFLDSFEQALKPVFTGYVRENKSTALIAVGCTGGKHRSVATTIELAHRLNQLPGVRARAHHRDLGLE